MSTRNDPLFLIGLVLSEPSEVVPMNKLINKAHRQRDCLQDLAPWRNYTELSFGISGTQDGMVCNFSVHPAAQAHLEAGISKDSMGRLMHKIILEKRQWVEALEKLPMELLSQLVVQAAASTSAFRDKACSMGRAITPDMALPKEMGKILKDFRRSKLHGNVETNPWQLELASFDGYSWSKPILIRARPMRRNYGASLKLLDPIPHALTDKPTLQLHYSSVLEADQQRIDRACQQGSQINATVLVGQQENRPSVAHIQKLQLP